MDWGCEQQHGKGALTIRGSFGRVFLQVMGQRPGAYRPSTWARRKKTTVPLRFEGAYRRAPSLRNGLSDFDRQRPRSSRCEESFPPRPTSHGETRQLKSTL